MNGERKYAAGLWYDRVCVLGGVGREGEGRRERGRERERFTFAYL